MPLIVADISHYRCRRKQRLAGERVAVKMRVPPTAKGAFLEATTLLDTYWRVVEFPAA
jgi:hypothetical protein